MVGHPAACERAGHGSWRENTATRLIYMRMTSCVIDRCAFTILYLTITEQVMVFQLVCRDIPDLTYFFF